MCLPLKGRGLECFLSNGLVKFVLDEMGRTEVQEVVEYASDDHE